MTIRGIHGPIRFWLPPAFALICAVSARADVVTQANAAAAEIASRSPKTPIAVRTMAIVQVSVFEAVNAITARYPRGEAGIAAAPGASVDAAVAAATRQALSALMPEERQEIDADYQSALALLPDGSAKSAGIAAGEGAATAVVKACADDGAASAPVYRPLATPAVYVPTTIPVMPGWGGRRPWVMNRGDQMRPDPPPDLGSATWARDYNEVQSLGARDGSTRTAEQTAIARFWEGTAPAVYWPVARSVAEAPGRDVTDNARLLAVAAMAMDDALIAVFDAKYAYNFWRPITAIRNGDLDGNDATSIDPNWTPFIDTPMHPEYPCAHCIVSAALGAVLEAEIGRGPSPTLRSASPTAGGAVRTWNNVGDFVQEVAVARIYDGVHYRTSTEVGAAMGRRIGQLAAAKFPLASR
jgi:hypothetical protein